MGLLLLSLSLVGSRPSSHEPHAGGVVVWLGASAGAAAILIAMRTNLPRAAALGLATGLLFADGDISAAGIATLVTNAVPIAAGFVLFSEALPPGARGGLQIAAFASIVAGAALLGTAAARKT